jgi:hypothetical protein
VEKEGEDMETERGFRDSRELHEAGKGSPWQIRSLDLNTTMRGRDRKVTNV